MVCSNPPKPGPRNLAKKKLFTQLYGGNNPSEKNPKGWKSARKSSGGMFVLVCPHLHVASHIAKVTAIALLFLRPHALEITEACHFCWSPKHFRTNTGQRITLPKTNIARKNGGISFSKGLFSGAMLVSGRVPPEFCRLLEREQFGRTKRGASMELPFFCW